MTAVLPCRGEATLRDRLGAYGRERVSISWSEDIDSVAVRVQATHPSVFPAWFSERLPFTTIDRTFEVRVEAVQ